MKKSTQRERDTSKRNHEKIMADAGQKAIEASHIAWLKEREATAERLALKRGLVFDCDNAYIFHDSGGDDAALFHDEELAVTLFRLWMRTKKELFYANLEEEQRQKAIEARRKSLKVV